jgi:hypothetical protein
VESKKAWELGLTNADAERGCSGSKSTDITLILVQMFLPAVVTKALARFAPFYPLI